MISADAGHARRLIVADADIIAAADQFVKTGGSLYGQILEKSVEEPESAPAPTAAQTATAQPATQEKTPCSADPNIGGGAWVAKCRNGFMECELQEYFNDKTGPAYDFSWDAEQKACRSAAQRECESKGLVWHKSQYYCLDHADDRADCLKQGAKWEPLPSGGYKCSCKIGNNSAEWTESACKCVATESASKETRTTISGTYSGYASDCANSWRSNTTCFGNIMTKSNTVDTTTKLACE